MANIVFVQNGQALTTSESIAVGVGLQHKNLLALVRKYRPDFEEFNPVAFKTRLGEALPQGGYGQGATFALLNEQQATLLVTYCRNTEKVRKFKVALVKAFYEARQQIQETRRSLTDDLIERYKNTYPMVKGKDGRLTFDSKTLPTKDELESIRQLFEFNRNPRWQDTLRDIHATLKLLGSPSCGNLWDFITERSWALMHIGKYLDRNGIEHSRSSYEISRMRTEDDVARAKEINRRKARGIEATFDRVGEGGW